MSMFDRSIRRAVLFLSLSCAVSAQEINLPTSSGGLGNTPTLNAMQTAQVDFNIFLVNSRDPHRPQVESPSDSVSELDLRAPRKARREYQKGYQLLMGKNLPGAVEHLTRAIALYPKFVAALNALGTAYLDLGKNEPARAEFASAAALDDHLPNSYLNLGCAELALRQYAAAEESLRKASSLAPLDVQLQSALVYGEFMNHDYAAVLATARQAAGRGKDAVPIVHFFAAGAWEAQGNFNNAEREMETLLREFPNSTSAGMFRQILEQIKAEQARQAEARLHPSREVTRVVTVLAKPTPEEAARHRQLLQQQKKEEDEIAAAEAETDPACVDCSRAEGAASPGASDSGAGLEPPSRSFPKPTFQVSADEVSVFFAAADHGKSVTDLSAADVEIRDDGRFPETIFEFRDESQLPLRLGLVVDTSDSIAKRFSFEQAAATRFLRETVVDKNDLAFVVGVNNSVLLAQDFTADQTLISRAINQLAPCGGTALWDAVAFAAGKLASHPEVRPVARILVVISDGDDDSSSTTLKQAIATAQRGGVAVYTVSTRSDLDDEPSAVLGDRALRTLSELTGGGAFVPGSIHRLDRSLDDLQQVIRSRYLVSYKPAEFQRNGQYRTIDIEAQKGGRKLRVFARRGYYASEVTTDSADN